MAPRVAALLFLLAAVACGALVITPSTPRPGVSARLSVEAASRAFQQGAEAASLGQPLSSNPFSSEDAARAWRAGWRWWGGG